MENKSLTVEFSMRNVTISEDKLKKMMKSALVEALEERRDLVHDIVEEAMEDIGLARAIEKGLESDSIPRKEVFAILEES